MGSRNIHQGYLAIRSAFSKEYVGRVPTHDRSSKLDRGGLARSYDEDAIQHWIYDFNIMYLTLLQCTATA